MKRSYAIMSSLIALCAGSARADFHPGTTLFHIYGGGSSISGQYHQPGVHEDEQKYADGGGMIGGQLLYFTRDNLALGIDVSHADYDSHMSNQLLTNRLTDSSADTTTGIFLARLVYPKGRWRPYIEGGVGLHSTSLDLLGRPINGDSWSDTLTTEDRRLVDSTHMGPALEGAIGMQIYFSERFFIGAEYKFISLIGKDFEPTPAGVNEGLLTSDGSVVSRNIGLMLGLGF